MVCMCVDAQTLEDAFALFPRSKYPLLKRSLQRRKAFMEQYQLLQEKIRSDLLIKQEQMKTVQEQLIRYKVDTMFKENLSAKMKDIRMTLTKKFNDERRASEIDREKKNQALAEEEKTRSEE